MTRLKIHLLGWIIILSIASCYKNGGELIITDNPPVVEIDTTVVSYATNLKVGNLAIPADTVFTTAFSANVFSLDFTIAERPTFTFVWEAPNQNPSLPIEGNYQASTVYVITDNAISLVEAWILDGMDINNYPPTPINVFVGGDISISEVEEDIRRYTLQTGEVMVVDRAKVTLSGSMLDVTTLEFKDISGSFTCNFSRPE